MRALRAKIDKMLEWALVFLMAVMVLNVLWQVFSRYILRAPSSFTDELSRFLLIWLGLLGASYGVGQKIHLAIELFTDRLSPPLRMLSDMFIAAIVFLFALLVMVAGGVRLMQITLVLEQISPALHLQVGYIYSVLPLSGLLMMFYAVDFARQSLHDGSEAGPA